MINARTQKLTEIPWFRNADRPRLRLILGDGNDEWRKELSGGAKTLSYI